MIDRSYIIVAKYNSMCKNAIYEVYSTINVSDYDFAGTSGYPFSRHFFVDVQKVKKICVRLFSVRRIIT